MHNSVDPGGLAVPLGTSTATGKQDKAQQARLASPGTRSSPFICFSGKNLQEFKTRPFRPTSQMQGLKKATGLQQKVN